MEKVEFPDDRPTIEATRKSRCGLCDETIHDGDMITLYDGEWCHNECVAEEERGQVPHQ